MTDFRALCIELTDCLEKADWPLRYRYVFRQWVDIARAALADEPAVPQPPAEGEVEGLVAWLRDDVDLSPADKRRAADLLEQRHPAPVPVSERLPGQEVAG